MNKALTPSNIGKVTVKNRIVFPSICTFFCNEDGTVSEDFREYFRSLCAGGIGLVIIPGNPHGKGSAARPFIGEDANKKDWGELSAIAHEYGARLFCQLHPVTVQDDSGACIEKPSDFTKEMIHRLTDSYGAAAKRLMDCGADGVEIQSCHERYIADFMSAKSNTRQDEYGRDTAGRTKIAIDILESIRKNCGSDFPVVFKISSDEMTPGGRELAETTEIAKLLEKAGADALTVTIGMTESEAYKCASMDMPDGYNMDAVKTVKDAVNIPVIGLVRIVSIEQAGRIVEAGMADFTAMGRAHLADPALVNKYLGVNKEPPVRCIGCNQGCRTGAAGNRKLIRCMQNPKLGRLDSLRFPTSNTLTEKRVMIVGAGPAGLQAAVLLAEHGVIPTLYDNNAEPGGMIRLAKLPPHKENMERLIECRVARLAQLGVKINYGVNVTPELVVQTKPDVLIIATGSQPLIPPIPGLDVSNALTGDDVLRDLPEGNSFAILGGGLIGCETAEFLAGMKKDVTIFEMREDIATELVASRRFFMLNRMNDLGITVHKNTRVLSIDLPAIHVENAKDNTRQTIDGFDQVVVCAGRRVDTAVQQALENAADGKVICVGDTNRPSLAIEAIHDATDAIQRLLWEYTA